MSVPLSVNPREPVGRDRELRELADWAGAARAGRSHGLVVSGDAGIGKTTLLAAFARRLAAEGNRPGAVVTVGHCVDLGGNPLPYLPFAEAFDRLSRADHAGFAAVRGRLPALGRLLGHDIGEAGRGPETAGGARAELFDAVRSGLELLAADVPVLVWLEDVHWADQSSLDLLSYLFTRGFERPVLLVVSYRSDDLHRRHPLRPVLAQWSRLPVLRLEVRPLAPEAVRALVGGLDDAPTDPAVVTDVVSRADGNAFFAEELAGAARWSSPAEALPDDLAELLLYRLHGLGEPSRAVVRAAAVGGRRVRHDLLAAVVGLPADELGAALREAVDGRLLRTDGDGYVFRHALLAEAVAGDLLPGERVRLHRAYLDALQGSGSGSGSGAASEIARHARAAGDDAVALVATVTAAREALAVGGPDEALAQAETALALLDRQRGRPADPSDPVATGAVSPGVDEVEVVLLASSAAVAAGLTDRAIRLLLERLERAPADGDPIRRARLLSELATVANLTEVEDGFGYAAEALGLVPDEPGALRAEVLLAYATGLVARGRRAEGLSWAERAQTMATELGLVSLAGSAATWVARLRARLGDPRASLTELAAVADEARARNDPTEIRPRYLVGMLAYETGDLDTALVNFLAAADRARDLGRPWVPYGVDGRAMAAITRYAQGRWDEALAVVDVAGQSPPGLARAMLLAGTLGVRAGRGDRTVLDDHRSIRRWWPGDGSIAVLASAAAIDVAGDAGDLEEAERIHRDLTDFLTATWFTPDFAAVVRFNALLMGQSAQRARLGRPDVVAALLDRTTELLEAGRRADRIAAEHRARGPESAAWAARLEAEAARLRWLAGDRPLDADLVAAWRAAVSGFETYPNVFEAARSRARLAAVLAASGDRSGARTVAAAARTTAAALGAHPLLAELDALGLRVGSGSDTDRAASSGRPGDGPTTGAGPLTAREAEVLALVAEGLSNAEIGRRLVISGKTASVHVSNILAKLGASGRTEAVTLARRRGLLG